MLQSAPPHLRHFIVHLEIRCGAHPCRRAGILCMAAEDVWEKSCCYRPWNGEDGLPIPPYAVYNIGNQNPENLLDFVQILSEELVRAKVLPEDYDFEAHKELVPMQPGDVPVTYADTSALERDFGYKPSTSLREGLRKFAEWYAEFYK